EDFMYQIEHKKQKKGIKMYYPRFTKIEHKKQKKGIKMYYPRFTKDTQQYGTILPIKLTNEDIRNTTFYKEYYAYATGVAAPKPKASARKKRGDADTSLTPPIATPTLITTAAPVTRIIAAAKGKQPAKAKSSFDFSKVARTEAEQLKIVLKRSRQETHISQHGGSSTNEGTDVEAQDEGDKNDESDDGSDDGNDDDNDKTVKDGSKRDNGDDDNDDEEEFAKIDEQEDTESGRDDEEVTKSDREDDEEETRQEEEESFDPIPRTPKGSEDEGNNEEDQDLRLNIRNTTVYKEYYAYATGVAAPKPKASARKKRGDPDTSLTPPIATPTLITTAAPVTRITAAAKGKQPAKAKSSFNFSKVARIEAEQLKIVLKRSRQETHISQHGGSSTNEGTGSKPGVPDVPSD
nr:hypothetical protein [Tanacetum cinerariifolium]